MRRLLLAAAVALALPGAAEAKFQLALALEDATPTAGQEVRVVLRADVAPAEVGPMRLVVTPPRGVGYETVLQAEESGWATTVRFDRAGEWLLVVPNWGAPGYAIPPPLVRTVEVAGASAGGRALVPWLPIGTVVAGALALLGLRWRGGARRPLPAETAPV